MNSFPKFGTYNFVPRNGVMERINHQLDSIIELAPSDANCTAIIERIDNRFIFEVTLRSSLELFRSTSTIDTVNDVCRDRMWQVEIVSAMCNEIYGQIIEWQQRRFAA